MAVGHLTETDSLEKGPNIQSVSVKSLVYVSVNRRIRSGTVGSDICLKTRQV